jgi:surfactin synthase thioesterase subunit/acyl carrier protein
VNGQARQHLLDRLQRHIAAKLGFSDAIDPDQPLNEIGLDSLMSVSLSNSLEDEFSIPIPIAELIGGPTINQLVDNVFGELADGPSTDHDEPRAAAVAAPNAGVKAAAIPATARIEDPASTIPADDASDGELATTTTPSPAGQIEQHVGPQQVAISQASVGNKGNGAGRENFSPIADVSHDGALRGTRKWLIAPQPNPAAKVRLFCFPYAGGGVVSFRTWPQLLDESVEIVAVEPPGRGTRINETPIDNMDYFVKSMLPELIEWLDRPSAFFGHCLGGVTMFATLCALPMARAELIKHVFACSVRPPHLLRRRGEFEDNLVYDMMLHKEFNVRVPPHAQADEIFVDIVRHFDTPAADRMLSIPKLRKLLLPTIRAEFGMAFNYNYRPVQPFSCPISSFVGDIDPWVSAEDSAGWREHTRGRFKNHVRKGSHFLMEEDREYILQVIKNEFVKQASH